MWPGGPGAEYLRYLLLVSGEEELPADAAGGGAQLPALVRETGRLHLPPLQPLAGTGRALVSAVYARLQQINALGTLYNTWLVAGVTGVTCMQCWTPPSCLMLAMTSATVVRGHEAALNQAAAAGESRSVGQPSLSYSQPRLRTAPLLPPAQCHMLVCWNHIWIVFCSSSPTFKINDNALRYAAQF